MKKYPVLELALFALIASSAQADSLWLEAEEPSSKSPTMGLIPFVGTGEDTKLYASNSKVLQLQSAQDGPHFVEYSFTLKISGKYKIWASTTPLNQTWASVFQVKVDGKEIEIEGTASGSAYGDPANPGMFQWHLMVELDLEEGDHSIAFDVKERRQALYPADGEKPGFSFLADAVLITNEGIKPDGPEKPKALKKADIDSEAKKD
jgi:hypothetical protein